jgi:hypothetical protein
VNAEGDHNTGHVDVADDDDAGGDVFFVVEPLDGNDGEEATVSGEVEVAGLSIGDNEGGETRVRPFVTDREGKNDSHLHDTSEWIEGETSVEESAGLDGPHPVEGEDDVAKIHEEGGGDLKDQTSLIINVDQFVHVSEELTEHEAVINTTLVIYCEGGMVAMLDYPIQNHPYHQND